MVSSKCVYIPCFLVIVLFLLLHFICLNFKELIDQQVATYDSSHERSFIDMYLNEMKKADAMNDKETTFSCTFDSSDLFTVCANYYFFLQKLLFL